MKYKIGYYIIDDDSITIMFYDSMFLGQSNIPAQLYVDKDDYRYDIIKSEIEKQIAKSQEVSYATDENGEYILDENGEKITEGTSSISYGDWDYTYHPVTDEEAEIFRKIINNAEPSQTSDQTVLDIIQEEAGAYFSGQKSPEDVASIIQSRINIYINESR